MSYLKTGDRVVPSSVNEDIHLIINPLVKYWFQEHVASLNKKFIS